jgi:hypothetical protein
MSEPAMRAQRTRQPRKPQAIVTSVQPVGGGQRSVGDLSPLQYLLRVVNDPTASDSRRDRAAVAAAPYVHPRPMATGKKQRQAKEAKEAGMGTEWGDDLKISDGRPQQ